MNEQINLEQLIHEADLQQELNEILEYIPGNEHYLVVGRKRNEEVPFFIIEIKNRKLNNKHRYKHAADMGDELKDIQKFYHLERLEDTNNFYEVYLMQSKYFELNEDFTKNLQIVISRGEKNV